MKPTLEEITQDLQALDSPLRAYELKYGTASADFYARYQQDLLDDEGFELSRECTRWASTYTMKAALLDPWLGRLAGTLDQRSAAIR